MTANSQLTLPRVTSIDHRKPTSLSRALTSFNLFLEAIGTPFRFVHVLNDVPSFEHGAIVVIIGQRFISARTDTPSLIPSRTAIPRQPGSMNESWL